LLRAKRDAEDDGGAVTLLVLLSNSWASYGVTNRSQIASDVWNLNQEGTVKIFSVGFPGADQELLRSIAIMNGGFTTSILEGYVDFKSQLGSFFNSEFGHILLSDVSVSLSSADALVYGETQRFFPVLSEGSEIVVRGLLNNTDWETPLQATTTAVTSDGLATWTATAVQETFVPTVDLPSSLCFQSYAHSRITQLLHLRDAAKLLGDGVIEPVVSLIKPCPKEKSLADCLEEEALSLALEANIVTRGLTGLLTVDDEGCLVFEEGAQVCLDGTSKDGAVEYDWAGEEDQGEPVMMGMASEASGACGQRYFASFAVILFLGLMFNILV
jgi:hypothetical protein